MTSNQTPLPTAPTASADRLPIIRFLLLFIALLVVATGLAALSFAALPSAAGTPATCRSCNVSSGLP